MLTSGSRKVHHDMIANAESLEALLHTAFGRGFKYLSVPINDRSYNDSVQQGEKICIAASKCFIVSFCMRVKIEADLLGLDLLRAI
jgi:glutathione peroxidase-family protein